MWDENTNDAIVCPYCGAAESCEHLLAVLDRTFGECLGGFAYERFGEFTDQVETAFAKALGADDVEDVDWDTDDLRELWEIARESHDAKNGDFALESTVLIRVVADLFLDAGGDEYANPESDGELPGMSSAPGVFHAKDPKTVFAKAREGLAVFLRQEGGVTTHLG